MDHGIEASRRLDSRLKASLVAVGVTGATMALGAAVGFGLRAALSVGLGAALSAANLWALAHIVAVLLPETEAGARAQSRAAWALVALVKMVGVLAVAWLLMRCGLVSPMGMLVGLCGLPIGIAIGSLVSDRRGA
ncbi:MAG: ATP synthase subunit I [Polyangiaceae bacterium]|jgi:hypothetical protein